MGIPNRQITFVLTSCGRFDLLRRTLASFFEHNDAPIEKYILVEDSGDEAVRDVLAEFPDIDFDLILNRPRRGQFPSIDLAYERVQTAYIFHCEDDWLFTKPGFIQPSLQLLEDFPDVIQILIRDPKEEKYGVDMPLETHKNISFRAPVISDHPSSYCYSFNPGLRRLADYKKIGPFRLLLEEENISDRAKQMGYRQLMLENGGVRHIGRHRHVADIFVHQVGHLKRLKNSILKRIAGAPPDRDKLKPVPVSCFIVACNEADRIERALISVHALVDEIIVVDSGSTDDTVKIAESYGAKVIFNKWEGDGPQKRFAEDQCRNHWLLNLDADEWLDTFLIDEIRNLFEKGDPKKPVWCLKRGDVYFGDSQLRWHMNLERMPRLYDRRRFRFTPQRLHTSVPRPKGQTGVLDGVLLHAHARILRDMLHKETNYAHIGMTKKPLPVLLARFFLDFPQCFLKHYFLRRHIFGGQKGFIYSMIRAYVRFLRTAMELEQRLGWVEKEKLRPIVPPSMPSEKKMIQKPLPISGFIIAHNEADRIGRALASLQGWVAEIVVVDAGSADGTQEIARAYGARVAEQPWLGHGLQKRFAEDQSRYDWLLNLDADEWVSGKLEHEIRALFAEGFPAESAYAFRRRDIYHGQLRGWHGMKSHPFVRLYDKRKMRFSPDPVIDSVEVNLSKTKKLRGILYHRAVRSVLHLARKENNYSSLDSQRVTKSLFSLSWRLWLEMPMFFFKFYILRRLTFGGFRGFCYAMIYSFARFQRIAKILERHPGWRR